jgi:hypothetical protein
MADLYVHLRMKECCRNTLKDLDQRKRKAKFRSGILATPSLNEALGNKPIDEAHNALSGGGANAGATAPETDLEQIAMTMCEKICQNHASKHEAAGELAESRFWRDMAVTITAASHVTGAGS